jgi:rfaE bifunctional protein nucleotidyltransferase chain/domain
MATHLHEVLSTSDGEPDPAPDGKVRTLEELAYIAAAERAAGKRIVLCHGVFDLLHMGHVRHLQQARGQGDRLIVTITADAFVNKGPGRPVFTGNLRAEMLSALSCVDWVGINNAPDAVPVIEAIQPDVYAKGSDYADEAADLSGKIRAERQLVESSGGQVIITHDITFSSSELLNRHFEIFEPKIRHFLDTMREGGGLQRLEKLIERMSELKVLLVGDAIIDEYRYVTPMGKSPKENLIATRFEEAETFAGGVIATANHVAALCKQVHVMTCLGDSADDEKIIFGRLQPNVQIVPVRRRGAPTTRKIRFIDKSYLRKLFEVYHFDDSALPGGLQDRFNIALAKVAGDYDLVIVNDFGHGLITDETVANLCGKSKFLAVNAQSNSANMGFNLITKYPRADIVCIDRPEAQLAVRSKTAEPATMVGELLPRIVDCKRFALTLGRDGCAIYDGQKAVQTIPALTGSVVDLVGAGDAFLAFAAPFAAAGADMTDVGFVGNVAGALKVGIVGHRSSIDRVTLVKSLRGLLT